MSLFDVALMVRRSSERSRVNPLLLQQVDAAFNAIDWSLLASKGFAKTGDYCFIYSYPPVRTLDTINADDIFAPSEVEAVSSELNVYLHIPYCTGICSYCYFAKVVDGPQMPVGKDEYIELLIRELDSKIHRYNPSAKIRTVYFGGGTPSTLEPSQIKRVLGHLQPLLLGDDAEVSFECSPETIADDLDKLKLLVDCGVTRVNLGVESLDDDVLRLMARRHTSDDTGRAYENLRKAGISNVAMDLIYAIPGQTLASWISTMCRAVGFAPESISCYRLRTHPMKAISKLDAQLYPAYQEGLQMQLAHGLILSDAGYVRASSQKYARSSERIYKQAERKRGITDNQLLSAGCGAYGFLNATFYWNTKSLNEYGAIARRGGHPTWIGRQLDRDELMRKSFVLGVHTREGINLRSFKNHFGVDARSIFADEIAESLTLKLLTDSGDALVPTELGYFFGDELSVRFYSPKVRLQLESLGMKYGMFWERDRYA